MAIRRGPSIGGRSDDLSVDPLAASATVVASLRTGLGGLSSGEAARRLKLFGPNRFKRKHPHSALKRLLVQFVDPLALLLWTAAALTAAVQLPQLTAAIVAIILLNGLFAFAQEYQAERATERLGAYLPQLARVRRDGVPTEVPVDRLVPGDVVELDEGERVSADIRLLEGSIEVDLSSLTGESQPQPRTAISEDDAARLLDSTGVVFAGSTCTSGRAAGVVFATGPRTELGRIAELSEITAAEQSPLQHQVRSAARMIAAVSLASGVALVPLGLLAGLDVTGAAVFAVSMLVANVPEGLLPTITLALAVGVRRMARRRALIKRLTAVEGLGATTVICTDKTGTLTLNQMRVASLWTPDNRSANSPESVRSPNAKLLGEVIGRCNNASRAKSGEGWTVTGDPTETALMDAAHRLGFGGGARRMAEFSFDPRLKRMSTLDERDGEVVLSVKGAPETVLPLCNSVVNGDGMSAVRMDQIERAHETMAGQGLRVLAVARREVTSAETPARVDAERDLTLIGLVGLHDPPRPEVPEAVARCKSAGVRIVVITGDNPLTATDIARRVGIVGREPVVLVGAAIAQKSDAELADLVIEHPDVIFARTTPEDKLRIVDALQARGEAVAVTGDGVNDAPALRAADIGVAMGASGTEVAREAASVILIDDNFATIVNAIEEGRAIYENIKKFVHYIFAHAPPEVIPFMIFALSGGAVPVPLTVMQILAIDLGTETLPALALGREPAEPGLMSRGPRRKSDRLITRRMLLRAWGVMGLSVTVCTLVAFYYALWRTGWRGGSGDLAATTSPYAIGSTMAFLAIVACQIGTAFAARTERVALRDIGVFTNRWLLWGIAFEILIAALVVFLPPLQPIFGTTTPTWDMMLLLVPFPFAVWAVDEWYRARLRKKDGEVSRP